MRGTVRGYYSALSLSIFPKGNKRIIIYHSGHNRFRLCNGLVISQYLRELPGNPVQGFMLNNCYRCGSLAVLHTVIHSKHLYRQNLLHRSIMPFSFCIHA